MRSLAGFRGTGLFTAFLILFALSSEAPAAQSARPSYAYVVVRAGQTLWSIARAYGVSVELITQLNGLRSPDAIRVGQQLKIPVQSAPKRSAPRVTQPTPSTPRVQNAAGRRQFVWPARGLLTSRFGWRHRRHHNGIDIGAAPGAPIVAARDGVVAYAGWYYSYGRTVIIDHGNGLTTLYGHTSSLAVRTGQSVSAGQLIATVGCTGRCTGPHLHFEIRVNGRALDPLALSLVETLPQPESRPAATAQPAAPPAPAIAETVVQRAAKIDGPNGQTVQHVAETLRNGQVVRRIEEITTVEGTHVVRIRRIYELVNGALELLAETRQVVQTLPPSPSPASPPAREP